MQRLRTGSRGVRVGAQAALAAGSCEPQQSALVLLCSSQSLAAHRDRREDRTRSGLGRPCQTPR